MRILYIDIDCLRADHLSCNGYLRRTTPNIDAIAAEGVSFTNCHAANSPCLPSRAALFTGRFGFNNGIVSHHGPGERLRPNSESHRQDPRRPFWIWHLWRNGFRTVAFSTFHDRHNAWWWAAGWQELYTPCRKKGSEIADDIAPPALEWLRRNAREDNWFLDVHFWDVHRLYRVPGEWLRRFEGEPAPAFPDEACIERYREFYGPRSPNDLHTGAPGDAAGDGYHPEDVRTVEAARRLLDGYDGSLAYVDYHVGLIVDELRKAGVYEETAIIVSADHGDSFGEHGQFSDHGIANVAVHNIPMVVKWPGLGGRGHCDALVYNLDLPPTICELLGLETPELWDGVSFAPALRGEAFAGRPYLVFDHGIYTLSRAVRTRDWLLMQMLHPGLYPYDEPFFLHDLRSDPYQQVNLYGREQERFAELAGYLAGWRQQQLERCGGPDPLEEMVPVGPFSYYTPEEMIERLKRTGREHLVPGLVERLARFHPERFGRGFQVRR